MKSQLLLCLCLLLSACRTTPTLSKLDIPPASTQPAAVETGPVYLLQKSIPDSLTVVYENQYIIRIDPQNHRVNAASTEATQAINTILAEFGVLELGDNSLPGMKEEDIKSIPEPTQTEMLNRRSVHFYRFPPNTDLQSVMDKFGAMPYVVSTAPTARAQAGGAEYGVIPAQR